MSIWERLGMRINPVVFFVSAGSILGFVALGAAMPKRVGAVFAGLQAFIVDHFGWLYVVSVGFFLGFVVWLLFSRYADIKLGDDDDEPEYSYFTWFSMLFSAGMGIGLLFYSVAEPVMHYSKPRVGPGATVEAAKEAMMVTFFHWGLHAWAIYIVLGLSLAYFTFRRKLPLTIRSAFYPIFGERIHGAIGNAIDIFAVFGTLFGVATSLGLGVLQVNAGLSKIGLAEVSTQNELILIVVITLIATVSVVSGVNLGIRRLSELNLFLGLLLLGFVFVAGPTSFLVGAFVEQAGGYIQTLIARTFLTDAFRSTDWQASWTMFYWGWWIAWSPFVGMFIARISRGRTIREFITGVLLVPSAFTLVWLAVFGNTALYLERFEHAGIVQAVNESVPTALFVMLEKLPLSSVTSVLATIVIITYFVTSSDSGSLVIDIITANGDPDPPVGQRIFWALMEGGVAAVLLLTGGLLALQTAAITTALPFCVLMVMMCFSLVRGLRTDAHFGEDQAGLEKRRMPQAK